MAGPDFLVDVGPSNATLSWLLIAILVAAVVANLVNGAILWAGFFSVVIAIALVPVVFTRNASIMVSWEILLLSVLPALAQVSGVFARPLGYLSVAALGLLVVAEINQFTSARLPGWFLAVFVVMTTMSVASVWTIVRYAANLMVGTNFVTTVDALMWDLVVASSVAVGFGVLFQIGLGRVEAT